MKQVSLVPCLMGFVAATDKGVGSQGYCIQLYEGVGFFPTKSPD